MLIQCEKCGRPVYVPSTMGRVECGYCYQQNTALQSRLITPDDLEWWVPLTEAADRLWKKSWAMDWLCLLGNEKKLEEVKARKYEAEKHWHEVIRTAEEVWENDRSIGEISGTIAKLQDLPESTAVQEWIDKLTQKRERLEAEKEIARLRGRAETETNEDRLTEIENSLEKLMEYSGVQEPLAFVRDRKEKLIRQRLELEEKEARQRKRKQRTRELIAVACVAVIVIQGLFFRNLIQPKRLEQARAYAQSKAYEQAEQTYSGLSGIAVFANGEVVEAAATELVSLRNEWAENLVRNEEWEKAIQVFRRAGNQVRADEVQATYAESLASEKEWQKAIDLWKQLPDTELIVSKLYTSWVEELAAGEKYREALDLYEYADQDVLVSKKITREWLYGELGKQLEMEGMTREAISAYQQAGEEEWVLRKVKQLSLQQVDEESKALLAQWQGASEEEQETLLKEIARQGKAFSGIDQQLKYWKLLDEKGIDPARVYPDGIEVRGLQIPEFSAGQEETLDPARPLVLVREEHSYSLRIEGFKKSTDFHDRSDEKCFSLRLMPVYWQQLPEDRRPESLDDCTCILLADSTYSHSGSVLYTSTMKDYVDEMVAKQKGTYNKKTYHEKSIITTSSLPTFTAEQTIWLWEYPDAAATRVASRREGSRNHSLTVDWRKEDKSGATFNQLGLSGSFDDSWVQDQLDTVWRSWR